MFYFHIFSIMLVFASTFIIVQHHRGVFRVHPVPYFLNVIGIGLQLPGIMGFLARHL